MLMQVLEKVSEDDKCTILVIDEAHLLDPKTLTDLRLLISSIDDEKTALKTSGGHRKGTRHARKNISSAGSQRTDYEIIREITAEGLITFLSFEIIAIFFCFNADLPPTVNLFSGKNGSKIG